jgi:hypothetical protein
MTHVDAFRISVNPLSAGPRGWMARPAMQG